MTKYYVDTSIWRDLHENRRDNLRPLGEWAFELFRKIRTNKDIALYSDIILNELLTYFNLNEINALFQNKLPLNALKKVDIYECQTKEARILSKTLGIPWADCLHAILARDNDAVMVTRDAHFWQLSDIANVKKPEDLF